MSPRAVTVGDRFSKILVEDLERTRLVQYAGASGDYNPLHSDEVHARDAVGFPGVFAHGMLTMAMSGTLLSDAVGIENVIRFGGRFKAQVWPGDTLTAVLDVLSIGVSGDGRACAELALRTANQDGVEVFTATATALIVVSDDE